MSEKKVCEIVQGLNDRSNVEKDMEEALELILGHFRGKYLDKLSKAFDKCKENSLNNPSKEMNLIYALKPFLPHEHREKLDEIADKLTLLTTLENIRKEVVQVEAAVVKDPAINEDGIYEIDELCMLKKKKGLRPDAIGVMLIMSLMGKR